MLSANEITISTIENGNLPEWLKYAKTFEIKAFKNASDLKQQLLLHVINNQNTNSNVTWYTDEFKKRKDSTIREDEHRRMALTQYLEQIEDIYKTIKNLKKIVEPCRGNPGFKEKEDPLSARLKYDILDLDENFNKMRSFVEKDPTCSLLVCGDSGAGKSSFINLLIGQKILPTSIQSNTSCQVRLTYGKTERAEIFDNNNQKHEIPKEKFSNELRGFLENKEDRSNKTCSSATIYLDSIILEGGLDIYDTIGLGESEKFNEELKKDLRDITGVIFLLKRNNPIGDETVGGLSQIINHMIGNGLPGGSMYFIINMCDLLQNNDAKELLKRNVESQLNTKCGKINPSEIATFSTKEELFLHDHGKMSKDYEMIMNQIQELHLNSICTNSVRVFEFLHLFVSKTIENIRLLEKLSTLQKDIRQKHIEKMRELENDRGLLIESFKKCNADLLKQKKKQAEIQVLEYFKTSEIKEAIIHKVVLAQNRLYNLGSIETIDDKIGLITQEVIFENLEKFNETKNLLKMICDEMISNFLHQFAEHQEEKEKIEQVIDKHISNVMSIINGDITKMDLQELLRLPSQQRNMIKTITPILVPIFKTQSFIKEGFNWSFSFILRKIKESNLNKFYVNTDSYVRNKAFTKYDSFIGKTKNIRTMMNVLFEAPRKATEDFKKYLYDDLENLKKNITVLEDDMRNQVKVYVTYKEIKLKMTEIYENLCQFDLLYLQRDKFYKRNIDIQMETGKTNTSEYETFPSIEGLAEFRNNEFKPIVTNRTRKLYKGSISNNFEAKSSSGVSDEKGSILIFKKKGDQTWSGLYQEYKYQKLIFNVHRKSYKEDIASCFINLKYHVIYSLASIDINSPEFPTFFTVELTSLRQYFQRIKNNLVETDSNHKRTLFNLLKTLLEQITSGLKYLHQQSLAHYDLTINSIAYHEETNQIKLTSICQPIKVEIDPDLNGWEQILNISHLPLSVFNNDITTMTQPQPSISSTKVHLKSVPIVKLDKTDKLYSAECDIYSLGIVIYHLWYSIHPFYHEIVERINTLSEWIDLLKTVKKIEGIIKFGSCEEPFSDQILTWTILCLENKYTAHTLNDETRQTKDMGEVHIGM